MSAWDKTSTTRSSIRRKSSFPTPLAPSSNASTRSIPRASSSTRWRSSGCSPASRFATGAILALKQFFVGRHSTVLLDDRSGYQPDLQVQRQVQSISHGVLRLEHFVGEWGAERRRIQITKLRGVKFRGGYHDVRIETGGLKVFPRVVAADDEGAPTLTSIVSGIEGSTRCSAAA
jgi:hypothetical protein